MGEPLEDADECIANAIWHDCREFLIPKTTDLEEAANIIIDRLEKAGYRIVIA